MFTLRNMLENCMTLKGLSYYNYCWNLQHKNAKVVQGSSHDCIGLVAFLKQQHGQISEITTSISNLIQFLLKHSNKILIQYYFIFKFVLINIIVVYPYKLKVRRKFGKVRKGYDS